ncbi:hypothetical protein D9M73_187300 [compost metagenome]
MAGQVLAGGGTAHAATGSGEVAEHIGNRGNFVVQCGVERLAAVLRFEGGEGFGLNLDALGQNQQQFGAFFRRGLRPGVERTVGGLYGGVHLGAAGLVDVDQHFAQGGVVHGVACAFTGDQLAVDQEVRLHGGSL